VHKPKIIAIVGPTASGKSAIGAYLAHKLGGEIISADSRQVYKGMRIISRAEPGHLVGVAHPRARYSTGRYVRDAKVAVTKVISRGHIPIVVGGAGFYIDPLLRGWSIPEVAPDKKLRAALAKKSPAQLFALLKKLDPTSARRIDKHNPVRLVRAIEIAKALGCVPALVREPPYRVLWLGLQKSKHVHAGVEMRLKADMVAEAKKLRQTLSKKRFLELGFEFALLVDYLDKKITRTVLVERLVKGEEEYSKRQMRWFKRNKDIRWVSGKTEALRLSKNFLTS